LGKTYTGDFPNNKHFVNDGEYEQFLMKDANEPIIELEIFEQVKEEIKRRSTVEIVNGTVKRKGTHYSAKQFKNEKHE
jgi:hypothetical protein